jgi:hypothetical protein
VTGKVGQHESPLAKQLRKDAEKKLREGQDVTTSERSNSMENLDNIPISDELKITRLGGLQGDDSLALIMKPSLKNRRRVLRSVHNIR